MTNKIKHVWDATSGEFVPERQQSWQRFQAWLAAQPWINKVAAAAAALRLIQIGQAAFWYDEGVSAVLARLPWKQMIAATAGDVHPPGYYIMLWLLARIVPITELTARLPSAIFSIAMIYLALAVARRLEVTQRGQVAIVIWIAISPLQLHYAQEARMYALLQLEVAAAILFMINRQKALLSGVLTLILYTHNYGVFYLPTLALACLAREINTGSRSSALEWYLANFKHWRWPDRARRGSKIIRHYWREIIKPWAIYFIVPAVAWLPWLAVLLRQMNTISGGYWIQPVTMPGVLYVFYQLLFAYSMPAPFQAIGIVLTYCLLIYGGWRIYQDRPRHWQLLLILILTPVILAIVASLIWRPLLLFRGLIGAALPLTILAVKAIEGIRTPHKKIYAYAMIAATLLAGLYGHYTNNVNNKGETTTWIDEIENQYVKGDVILALNDNGIIAAMTYAPDLPLYKLASCGADPLGSLSQATRQALGIEEKSIDELINTVAAGYNPKETYSRIWYISTVAPVSPQCEIVLANEIINSSRYRVTLKQLLADTEYAQAGVYLITSKEVY